MTHCLPDNLLALFAARPAVGYKPPIDELLIDRNEKRPPLTGMAQYVSLFEDPADTPPKPEVETKAQKRARRRKEKEELLAYKIEQGIAMWNPVENADATKDPYKTLFVARINYETSESKLKREFETYGRIEKLSLVNDSTGKPRGYAFIEYREKNDMHDAYKKGDGIKIDGRRVVVDYERGRTQKNWLPRRLGGGKGDTRRTKEARSDKDIPEDRAGSGSRDRERNGSSSRHRSRSRDRSERDNRPDRPDRRDHRDRDRRDHRGRERRH